ncbi:hypothetical protein DQ04_10631050, partial [Trypanosoma grayi]|uniref:hypothetical protein n=1 Tax=Trypanosoma grayi TaxID=71804 RepID=UPI0004F424DF
ATLTWRMRPPPTATPRGEAAIPLQQSGVHALDVGCVILRLAPAVKRRFQELWTLSSCVLWVVSQSGHRQISAENVHLLRESGIVCHATSELTGACVIPSFREGEKKPSGTRRPRVAARWGTNCWRPLRDSCSFQQHFVAFALCAVGFSFAS